MIGSQFKAWREGHGLTQQQIAERMKVTRTTIQNWEALPDDIPQAVNMMVEVIDVRLKQEDPLLGPVTLIYSDGPMFMDPHGPRRPLAKMLQEAYPTNAMAIARVQELSLQSDFYNPFVIARNNETIWNSVQLSRVLNGDDHGAPTLINLLRAIAQYVRTNSSIFARGPKSLTQDEAAERRKAIAVQADELDRIADAGLQGAINSRSQINAVFDRLINHLGTRIPDALLSGISHAFVILSKNRTQLPEPRMVGPKWVIDYRGYEISYPQVPQMGGHCYVTIGSKRGELQVKIGRDNLIMAPDRDAGVQEAVQRIDAALKL